MIDNQPKKTCYVNDALEHEEKRLITLKDSVVKQYAEVSKELSELGEKVISYRTGALAMVFGAVLGIGIARGAVPEKYVPAAKNVAAAAEAFGVGYVFAKRSTRHLGQIESDLIVQHDLFYKQIELNNHLAAIHGAQDRLVGCEGGGSCCGTAPDKAKNVVMVPHNYTRTLN